VQFVSDTVVGSGALSGDEAVDDLGSRLKEVRLRSGMSLREVSRQLGVSPSFISQMENGKALPSVATLYAVAQLLDVSIDDLFGNVPKSPGQQSRAGVVDPVHREMAPSLVAEGVVVDRSDFATPSDPWSEEHGEVGLRIVHPDERPRLVMDSGVVWEQLAPEASQGLDVLEIIYPAGASSTNDSRMLRHAGVEYGYVLAGTVQLTYGFETHLLEAGTSIQLDPMVPHLLTNPGTVEARGIWVFHHSG
jgi:transcriptional regulator with XRE-family HTH domain